jgi:hypothetical protein
MSGPRRNGPATSDARSLIPDQYFLGTVVKEMSRFTNALEDCNDRSGTDCRVTFSITVLVDHWGDDPHRLAYESDHHMYATFRNIQDGMSKDTQVVPKLKRLMVKCLEEGPSPPTLREPPKEFVNLRCEGRQTVAQACHILWNKGTGIRVYK